MEKIDETNVETEHQPSAVLALAWRELSVNDIESLMRIANEIHTELPESDNVFCERVKLFREGCLALVDLKTGQLYGYAITHPIRRGQPPGLNSLLTEIVPNADQYYIHDLAILPELHGRGFARECIEIVLENAKQFPTTGLVSVYGTAPFWGRFGFSPKEVDDVLRRKLMGYGEDATYLERSNDEYQRHTEVAKEML
ncbi:MAG: hypothetical protein M1820_006905 [Bogoriella megaspora]|nr:MAG: hypothetical protein M1820_006905 [Bogoriella megaspora]